MSNFEEWFCKQTEGQFNKELPGNISHPELIKILAKTWARSGWDESKKNSQEVIKKALELLDNIRTTKACELLKNYVEER